MRKVSPLGIVLAKALIGLLVLEILLFAAGKLVSRAGIISPPRKIGERLVEQGAPPLSDAQRDSPAQVSVVYTPVGGFQVHVDLALLQSINGARSPQKYQVDSDGRIAGNQAPVIPHNKKEAFSVCEIEGVSASVINAHWVQMPGGDPAPYISDRMPAALRSILLRRPPLYICDVWIEVHPNLDGEKVRDQLQSTADAVADAIKNGG